MAKYVCSVCGYVYDPEEGAEDQGIAPGTPFEDRRTILSVRCAASARTCSKCRNKAEENQKEGPLPKHWVLFL